MAGDFLKDFSITSAMIGAIVGGLLVYLVIGDQAPARLNQPETQKSTSNTQPKGTKKSDGLMGLNLQPEKKRLHPASAKQSRNSGDKGSIGKREEITEKTVSRQPLAKSDRGTARMNFSALEKPGLIVATLPQKETTKATSDEIVRDLAINSGDTLMGILLDAGANRRQAHGAISALADVYDPRDLRPGQQLQITFRADTFFADDATPDSDSRPLTLIKLVIEPSPERTVIASLSEDGYKAEDFVEKLETRIIRAKGRIDDSLYLSAERVNVPPGIIIDMIHLYSFDVDFQRDIQPGDKFELLYESQYTIDGQFVRNGEVKYAQLTLGKVALPLYWYKFENGDVDYFNDKGESVRKALMKTPVDGARLSSRFGRRKHPILGYNKMHRGVDFAAPRGTPIMAAGDGTVEFAGRHGGYGRYVRIRHNSEFKTAYAHMRGIAKGARKGKRVKQGQIIGWVGSTGRSTGPHLHYEILRKGRQINPLGLKLPTGRKLSGTDLTAFQTLRAATYLAFEKAAQISTPTSTLAATK